MSNLNFKKFDKYIDKLRKKLTEVWEKGIWHKILVISIFILILPVFLLAVARLIYKRFNDNALSTVITTLFIVIIWLPLTGIWFRALFQKNYTQKTLNKTEIVNDTLTPIKKSNTALTPVPTDIYMIDSTITPTQVKTSPVPVPTDFDSSLGNNYVAAKYAEQMFNITNNASPGAITHMMIELSPETIDDKSEEEYINSVRSSFLTVKVTSSFWNSLSDDYQKDLVASFVTSLGNIFTKSYPHIVITNGVRKVATGEYNLLKTEPKISLL